MEEENKRLLDTLIRHSKSKASNASTPSASNSYFPKNAFKENPASQAQAN